MAINLTANWGDRLRLLLRRNGLSQRSLAERLSVSPMTVTKWTKGGGISDENLERLCATLSATRSWLRWGEEYFSDSIHTDTLSWGPGVTQRINSVDSRLSLASSTEASHGFVTWMVDPEASTVQWSGNAHRFFGIGVGTGDSESPLHSEMARYMSDSDKSSMARVINSIMSGEMQTGWIRFELSHMPDVLFLSVMRGVLAPGGHHRVFGMTISSGGILSAHISRWDGPASCMLGS